MTLHQRLVFRTPNWSGSGIFRLHLVSSPGYAYGSTELLVPINLTLRSVRE